MTATPPCDGIRKALRHLPVGFSDGSWECFAEINTGICEIIIRKHQPGTSIYALNGRLIDALDAACQEAAKETTNKPFWRKAFLATRQRTRMGRPGILWRITRAHILDDIAQAIADLDDLGIFVRRDAFDELLDQIVQNAAKHSCVFEGRDIATVLSRAAHRLTFKKLTPAVMRELIRDYRNTAWEIAEAKIRRQDVERRRRRRSAF